MKSKILSMIIAIVMVIGLVPGFAVAVSAAEVASGEGAFEKDADGYYEIANANDWSLFARTAAIDASAKARLVSDVDFTGVTDFSEYVIKSFSGILDGQGFTVKNIEASFTNKAFAFFTTIQEGGVVRNLKFDDVSLTLTSGSYDVALIAQTNRGRIENISASDVMVNAYYASVYARYNYGTISNCDASNIDLDALYTSGGIACVNYVGAVIEYCDITSGTVTLYNSGTSSDVYGGGIVGSVSGGSILNCSNGATVSVTGGRTVSAGGIAGYITSPSSTPASFIGCRNTGNVSTTDLNTGNGSDYAGGITGYNSSGYYNVEECYNTGNITARVGAAGICGYRPYGSANLINNCWNSGTITTTDTSTSSGAAGIAGSGNAIVQNCLNIGTVVTAGYGNPIVATSSGSQPGKTKLVNSFALDGCVVSSVEGGTVSGTQYYGYDASGTRIATGVSATDLANGTVLAALNAGNTKPVWGQVEGNAHPILLANNDLVKTTVTIGGVTATNKTYDGTANVGYTGTIAATPDYDISKITVTYRGTEANGTAYSSAEAPKNAGEYTVTFAIPATDLIYDGELTLSFKITKAAASDVVTPEAENALINTTLGDITLAEGWAWADGTTQLLVAGTTVYDVYYALTDEEVNNYDYSTIDGFNADEKKIERKVSVTVTPIPITYVAEVNGTSYESIADAISAAAAIENSTLKLLSNVTEGIIIENGTFTLDLNGYSITDNNAGSALIIDGGNIIITDSSAAKTGSISGSDYGVKVLGGTCKINDGTIRSDIGAYVQGGRFEINGGTIYGTTYSGEHSVIVYGGSCTINGGSFSHDPSNWLAEHYIASLNNETNMYDVAFDPNAPTTNEKLEAQIEKLIADLDTAIAELENAIDSKADADDIAAAIKEVTDIIDVLDDTYATDSAVANAISKAETELAEAVSTLEDKIAKEVEKLQGQINANDTDIEGINTSITTINGLIDTLKKVDEALDGDISDAITKAENELKAAQDELKDLIGDVQTNLDKAIADLNAAMNKSDADLSTEIANLNTALANAQAALEKADTDNKAELVSKIDTADKALDDAIKAVQKNLDDAKAVLDKAIADGDTALDAKITNLNAALESAKAALEATDAANKTELEGKITSAQTSLQTAIDNVQTNLDNAKAELDKAIADLDAAMNKGDADLSTEIANLNTSLANAQAALEKADTDNKAELEGKITEAQTTLQSAIDKVAKDLADAKTALEKAISDGNSALSDRISALNTALDNAISAYQAADGALAAMLDLGQESGPMNHAFDLKGAYAE